MVFPAIHNYMDYTDDDCADNFTLGQIERIRIQIKCHRGTDLALRVQECGSEFLLDQTLEGGYWSRVRFK